jgi:hypothetical protein
MGKGLTICHQVTVSTEPKLNILRRRLPLKSEFILVFGVAVFVVHGWSMREFLYKMPAFLLYYSVGEVYSVFSYMMAFALLESTVVTALLVACAWILPSKLLREGFGYKGFLAILVASILSIWFQGTLTNQYPDNSLLFAGSGIAALVFVLLAFLFQKVGFLQKIALNLADRLGIMTYLYVPLGLIGFLVYILRSLFHIIQAIR